MDRHRVFATLVTLAAVASGCAAGAEKEGVPPGMDDSEDASPGSDGDFNLGDTAGFIPDSVADGSGACVAKSVAAEQTPLDMLILLDASASMLDHTTPQKWATVVDALTKFFDDSASKGISVGLTIFPLGLAGVCSAATYKDPLIGYGPLPGNRAALVKAMKDTDPKGNLSGGTPLHSVTEGGLAGAIEWKKNHPGRAVVAVLATDGKSTCVTSVEPTNSAANALAKGVPTYVIGMKGAELAQLNTIAAAGGTKKLYDATNIALFAKKMEEIRAMALPCEVLIPAPPAGETFDRNKVNVVYTPGSGGAAQTIPYVANAAGCGAAGGWYYDDDAKPTKVIYCAATCAIVQGDTAAKIDVAFGCKSVVPK